MKKPILFSILLLTCVFSLPTALQAQTAACNVVNACQIRWDVTHQATKPKGCSDVCGSNEFFYCWLKTNKTSAGVPCPPAKATAEGDPGPHCPSCGHPINLASGNVYIQDGDVVVPGLGGGLALGRTWNSILPDAENSPNGTNMFGMQWRSDYEERVYVGLDLFIKYIRGDGSVWSFAWDPTTSKYGTAAPSNDPTQLVFDNTTNLWTMTFQGGSKRVFDDTKAGALTAIIDRNGNTTTLTYDGSNRLTSVTDPAGRHLNFTYGTTQATLYIVQGVASPEAGISLAYTYDASNRLTQVTKQDGKHVNYAYNAQNLITSVSDDHGVLESHTYDAQGRGLTSSRANGVDAVTVTYPQ